MKNFRLIAILAFAFSLVVSVNAFATNFSTSSTDTTTPTVNTTNPATTTASPGFSPSQVKDIQKIVHNYLIKNPNVLVEASQALQKQQAVLAQKNAMGAIETQKQEIFNNPKTPTAGNPDGSIYLVEFFDYQCGHCKAMGPIVKSLTKNNSKVKLIFKELPIFGGASRYAAKMALASTVQGKYYVFHNALFNVKGPLSKSKVLKIAKRVGLNVSKLKKDAEKPWVTKQLRANFRLAQQLKLVGTPAFIIGNQQLITFRFIPGATSQAELAKQIKAIG